MVTIVPWLQRSNTVTVAVERPPQNGLSLNGGYQFGIGLHVQVRIAFEKLDLLRSFKSAQVFQFQKRPGVSVSQSAQVFQFHKVPRCFSFTKCPAVSVSQSAKVFPLQNAPRCFNFAKRPGVLLSPSAKVRLYLAKRGHTLHRNLLPGKPLSKSFFFF